MVQSEFVMEHSLASEEQYISWKVSLPAWEDRDRTEVSQKCTQWSRTLHTQFWHQTDSRRRGANWPKLQMTTNEEESGPGLISCYKEKMG